MSQVILGVNNGFALRRWPEPAAWASVVAGSFGLKEVQFSFDLLDPMLPPPARADLCREVTGACATYGLSIRSTFTGLIVYAQNHLAHPDPAVRAHALRWYEAALEATSLLGGEACGGHIGAMSAADYANPQRFSYLRASLVESVQQLTRIAASLGQKYFLWEPMPSPRELPHTPEEAAELMTEVNAGAAVPVYLCFDVGHCSAYDLAEPGDPHVWLERLLPWVRVIHLQQTDGKGDRHWPFTPEFAAQGIIDPQRIVETARSSPFEQIPLLFELGHAMDAPDSQVIEDHQRSVEAWARWL